MLFRSTLTILVEVVTLWSFLPLLAVEFLLVLPGKVMLEATLDVQFIICSAKLPIMKLDSL